MLHPCVYSNKNLKIVLVYIISVYIILMDVCTLKTFCRQQSARMLGKIGNFGLIGVFALMR